MGRLLFSKIRGVFALALAVAASTAASASDDFKLLKIDGRIVRWTMTGAPLVLTYAIVDRRMSIGDFGTCGEVTSPAPLLSRSRITNTGLESAVERALDQWQRNVNVVFVPAPSAREAQIVIGAMSTARGIAFTDLSLDKSPDQRSDTGAINAAVICLNAEKNWKIGFDGQSDQYDLEHVIAHEIGHVLGLDHPSAHGHVMSFRYSESRRELSAGDRQGAIQLYGPKPLTSR